MRIYGWIDSLIVGGNYASNFQINWPFSSSILHKFYFPNCQIFFFKLSKFLFSNCQNFSFQTVKIFLFKLSKFLFSNCQNFSFQTVKISLFKLSKFPFSNCQNFISKLSNLSIQTVKIQVTKSTLNNPSPSKRINRPTKNQIMYLTLEITTAINYGHFLHVIENNAEQHLQHKRTRSLQKIRNTFRGGITIKIWIIKRINRNGME